MDSSFDVPETLQSSLGDSDQAIEILEMLRLISGDPQFVSIPQGAAAPDGELEKIESLPVSSSSQ